MERRILCAGFGGQGVLAMGQMMTYAGMVEGKEVSWLPSYGPEMRGGAANCSVVISDDAVGAPNIDIATDVLVMNQPSFEKFKDIVAEGGNLFINTSLVDSGDYTNDKINIYKVPVSSTAQELGNIKMANMVMLGAFLEVTNLLELDSIIEAFQKVFGDKKAHLIPKNKEALNLGMDLIKNGDKGSDEETTHYRKTPKAFAYDSELNSDITFEYDNQIFADPLETAKFALSFEQNTISYYNEVAEKLDDAYSEIFKSVAKQEEEHVAYLKELVDSLEGNKSSFDKNFDAYEATVIFTNKMDDDLDDEMIITALKNAMYIESNAVQFYREASEKIEDPKSKELYTELIKWEELHFDQIDDHTELQQEEWWADQSYSKF